VRYAQYAPSARFTPIVERYWFLEGIGDGSADQIFPDGRVEIIFHYGGPFFRELPDGAIERQPGAIVAGQMLAPVTLRHDGNAGVAAIRLRPAASASIYGGSAKDLTGHLFDARDLVRSVDDVRERLASADTDPERIAVLECWLEQIVPISPQPLVHAAVETIVRCGGTIDLRRLADRSGLSVRQLERRFSTGVGLSPKAFARLVRLQRALRRIRRGDTLRDVAHACGYYDQPHMTRDFSALANTSPAAWRVHDGELAPLFVA
jgi:AraC-like DNA-binding protein